MSRSHVSIAIMAFVIAWLVVPLLLPFTLGADALAGALIIVVFILRTIDRIEKDRKFALWLLGGVVVGVLVALLVPQFKATALTGYGPIFSALFGLLFAYMI